LAQPFYNLGYSIGQSIGKALFGDPAEEQRKRMEEALRAQENARAAEIARQQAEAREAIRKAEEEHKRQEQYDRLSSQLQLSEGFDGQRTGPALMLGDSDDSLRPRGTAFFGMGGGAGGSATGTNDSKVVDLRQRQGYSAAAAAPAKPADTLPLIMGDPNEKPSPAPHTDPNVVDFRDKKAPYIVDPKVMKGETELGRPERMRGDAVISGINTLAKRLEWNADKLIRLDKALNNLSLDSSVTRETQVGRVWQDIKARSEDRDIAQEASRGEGPGYFPGAGTQTPGHQDCAIFALANAAQLPYGVVAARACELIRDGEWRSAAERANPQKTIEEIGLNGGEVIMLAEAFGKAEVVSPVDFARTLKNGRPVLVNLAGHEVVLTKTFLHGKETWYEMMDSYQGPMQRLYMSDKELNSLLKEKGVSFRPERGTVPKLLR
jgi:hypothetical protein